MSPWVVTKVTDIVYYKISILTFIFVIFYLGWLEEEGEVVVGEVDVMVGFIIIVPGGEGGVSHIWAK